MKQYICRDCGQTLPVAPTPFLCPCGGLFDLDFEPAFPLDKIAGREWSLWRYREAIPIASGSEVSLGEGCTPLVDLEVDGRVVRVKQEQLFPTGSFKDRGAAVLLSLARELGVGSVVEDSSGNAGAAVAAYAARAGIACRIFVPQDTAPAKLAQIAAFGAEMNLVPGSREDTARACLDAAQDTFYATHCYNPFFHHGTKTFAFEICEQLGVCEQLAANGSWQAPDVCVLPGGNGTLLLGAALGFAELLRAGVIDRTPRLIAVQAENCSPLAQAFERGAETWTPEDAMNTRPTLAEGIAIAEPVQGARMLRAVRDSGGRFVTVGEGDIQEAVRLAASRGFFIEPTGAAALAGTRKVLADIPPDQTVVTAFTGHGLKAADKVGKVLRAYKG